MVVNIGYFTVKVSLAKLEDGRSGILHRESCHQLLISYLREVTSFGCDSIEKNRAREPPLLGGIPSSDIDGPSPEVPQ